MERQTPTDTKAQILDALIVAGDKGLTPREIAKNLGIPSETVRSAIETLSGLASLYENEDGRTTRYFIERRWLAVWIVENAPSYEGPGG